MECDNVIILHEVQNKNRFDNWLNEFYPDSDVLFFCNCFSWCSPCIETNKLFSFLYISAFPLFYMQGLCRRYVINNLSFDTTVV